jgi:hypothetical protein
MPVRLAEPHAAAAAERSVDQAAGAYDDVLGARGAEERADVVLAAVLAVHGAPDERVEDEADEDPAVPGIDELGAADGDAREAVPFGGLCRLFEAELVDLRVSAQVK